MSFLDNPNFWKVLWTIYLILFLTFIPWDIVAMMRGNHDKVGDAFTFTHWLVKYIGISTIAAVIGYLVGHFLIVHRNG